MRPLPCDLGFSDKDALLAECDKLCPRQLFQSTIFYRSQHTLRRRSVWSRNRQQPRIKSTDLLRQAPKIIKVGLGLNVALRKWFHRICLAGSAISCGGSDGIHICGRSQKRLEFRLHGRRSPQRRIAAADHPIAPSVEGQLYSRSRRPISSFPRPPMRCRHGHDPVRAIHTGSGPIVTLYLNGVFLKLCGARVDRQTGGR